MLSPEPYPSGRVPGSVDDKRSRSIDASSPSRARDQIVDPQALAPISRHDPHEPERLIRILACAGGSQRRLGSSGSTSPGEETKQRRGGNRGRSSERSPSHRKKHIRRFRDCRPDRNTGARS